MTLDLRKHTDRHESFTLTVPTFGGSGHSSNERRSGLSFGPVVPSKLFTAAVVVTLVISPLSPVIADRAHASEGGAMEDDSSEVTDSGQGNETGQSGEDSGENTESVHDDIQTDAEGGGGGDQPEQSEEQEKDTGGSAEGTQSADSSEGADQKEADENVEDGSESEASSESGEDGSVSEELSDETESEKEEVEKDTSEEEGVGTESEAGVNDPDESDETESKEENGSGSEEGGADTGADGERVGEEEQAGGADETEEEEGGDEETDSSNEGGSHDETKDESPDSEGSHEGEVSRELYRELRAEIEREVREEFDHHRAEGTETDHDRADLFGSFSESDCTLLSDGELYCRSADSSYRDRAPRQEGVVAHPDERGIKQVVFQEGGNRLRVLTDNDVDDVSPVYSREGRLVAWQRSVGDRWQVVVYDLRSDREVFVTDASFNNINPELSPTGVIWQGWVDNGWDVFYADRGSGEWTSRRLTDDRYQNVDPKVYGDAAVWRSYRDGVWHVISYALGAGVERSVGSGRRASEPRLVLVWDGVDPEGRETMMQFDLSTERVGVLTRRADDSLPDPIPNPFDGTSNEAVQSPSRTLGEESEEGEEEDEDDPDDTDGPLHVFEHEEEHHSDEVGDGAESVDVSEE